MVGARSFIVMDFASGRFIVFHRNRISTAPHRNRTPPYRGADVLDSIASGRDRTGPSSGCDSSRPDASLKLSYSRLYPFEPCHLQLSPPDNGSANATSNRSVRMPARLRIAILISPAGNSFISVTMLSRPCVSCCSRFVFRCSSRRSCSTTLDSFLASAACPISTLHRLPGRSSCRPRVANRSGIRVQPDLKRTIGPVHQRQPNVHRRTMHLPQSEGRMFNHSRIVSTHRAMVRRENDALPLKGTAPIAANDCRMV